MLTGRADKESKVEPAVCVGGMSRRFGNRLVALPISPHFYRTGERIMLVSYK